PVTFTIQPSDLSPIALQAPASISGPPGPSFEIAWGVTNQGVGPVAQYESWVDRVYLSTQPKRDRWGDSVLATCIERGPIAQGQSYWRSQVVRAPVIQNGSFYLVLSTDDDNNLFESDESNNLVAVPVTFQIDRPDLAPLALEVPKVVDSSPNPSIQFTWGVTNQGLGPAIPSGSWSDAVYLSTDALFDYSDPLILNRQEAGPLPAGGSYWRTQNAQVPVRVTGDYYLIFRTDAASTLGDANYTNNTLAVPVHFNISAPDLAPIAFIVPTNVVDAPNSAMTIVWGVTNQGPGTIASSATSWVDRVFLSPDPILHPYWDTVIASGVQNGPLAAGGTYWRTNLVRLPVSTNGHYYLFCSIASDPNRLVESDTSNNLATAEVTFQINPPDLLPIALLCQTQISSAFPSITLAWAVTNQGTGPAIGSPFPWTDSISLVTLDQPGGWFTYFWNWQQTNVIPPGETQWTTNTIVLPIPKSGDYRLTLTTDSRDDLAESIKTNNSTSILLSATVLPPKVAPVYLGLEGQIGSSVNPSATIVCGVTNQGSTPAWAGPNSYWRDRLYLSTSATLDASAVVVATWQQTNSIAAGVSYWRTNNVRLPARTSGDYFLILTVDPDNVLQQVDTSNNVAVTSIKITVLPADLTPALFLAPSIATNPSLTLIWGVTNQGSGPAESQWGWSDGIYLSTSPTPDGTEQLVRSYYITNTLAPGSVYWRTNDVRLPVTASGTFYLMFKTVCYGSVLESDYNNNTTVTPVTFTIGVPDLAPIFLQVPSSVGSVPHPRVTVIVGVTNQGSGFAFAGNDTLYLSATPRRDVSAARVATWPRTAPVQPGTTYWITNTVEMPVSDSGRYYLVFEADGDDALGESDLLNNSAVVAIDLDLSLPPDLAVVDFQAPPFVVAPANPPIQLAWHIKNQGLGPAARPWADAVLLFPGSASGSPILLGRFAETNPIPAGADYWRTNTLVLPATQSGGFLLKLRTDSEGDLFEFEESNNESVANVVFTFVAPPKIILGPGRMRDDGSFELAVTGLPGARYKLQTSTNLLDWVSVCNFSCTQQTTWVQDPGPNSGECFYRVVDSVATPAVTRAGADDNGRR
ncbi:MAG TPA: hypothetical protein VFE51_05505, partial [Verrucomicrobiae bacterium]|nr:hypothetical protein [Verrucomicrobiae bacterium]